MKSDYCISCSSSRVALLAFKEMTHEIITESAFFNPFKIKCLSFRVQLMDYAFKPLLRSFFNATANNFTLTLKRREVAKKLTLKMVKELKKRKDA